MKTKSTLLIIALLSSLGLFAQSSLSYSLARPIGGGDMRLLETDLAAGTDTVIDTYLSSEIDDYDPGSTTFDHQNGRFIALGSDLVGNVSLVGLNIVNGDIEYAYSSNTYELFSVEYYDGSVYSLARPIGGGDMRLLETNLTSGAETVIDTYLSSEIDDYNPGATTFDYQNGRFIALGSDLAENPSLVGLNIVNGDIDYSYSSNNYELFSVEYGGGNVYSLARPIGGGDMRLLETNLTSGAETVIDSYPSSELDDYDPGATSFDRQYARFITLGSDIAEDPVLVSLNTTNGDIDYAFASTNYELFSIETGGLVSVGLSEQSDSEEWISIYPNPSQNLLTINSSTKYTKLEIVDLLGKTVLTNHDERTVIDVSHLPSGTYWIMLSTANGIQVKPFIKE